MNPSVVQGPYLSDDSSLQPLNSNNNGVQAKRSHKKFRVALLAALLFVVVTAAGSYFLFGNDIVNAQAWVVKPNGSVSAAGTSPDSAISLQAALDRAQPGDVIQLQPGVYNISTALKTKRDGEPNKPITIKGSEIGLGISGRNKTVITGPGHIIDVDHSYYTFDGFTINGQPNLNFNDIPTSPSEIVAYKNANQPKIVDGRLIYIGNSTRGVKGIVINNMFLTGAGGECVRMRSFASDNVVSNSYIFRCGFMKKDKPYPYHNGEGVYIGTSTKSDTQPFYLSDNTTRNTVKGNIIDTLGSECVNIKENASENMIDSNECRNGLGPASDNESILEVRGKNNTIVNNVIQRSEGFGIKLWSDAPEYGGGNIVARNRMSDIKGSTITVKGQSQPKEVCEITYEGTPVLMGLTDTNISKKCSQDYGTGLQVPPQPISTPPAPTIKSISPNKGSSSGNYDVTIKIANFPGGDPVVMFGTQRSGTVRRVDSETVVAKVPESSQANTVPTLVKVGDKSANMPFTYENASMTPPDPAPKPPSNPTPPVVSAPVPGPGTVTYLTERFDNLNQLTKVRGGTWKVSDFKELQLADPKDDLAVGNANMIIFSKNLPKAYELTVQGKVKATSSEFNDFSILFDYADQSNYSFVSFNEKNDGNTSGVFIVRDGKLTQVADIVQRIDADKYYSVVMVHSESGDVTLRLDGATVATQVRMPAMAGSMIGLGTRNDSARFDDFSVKSLP